MVRKEEKNGEGALYREVLAASLVLFECPACSHFRLAARSTRLLCQFLDWRFWKRGLSVCE